MQHKQPEPGVPGEQIPLKHLLTFDSIEPNIWLRKQARVSDDTPLCLFEAPPNPSPRPGFPAYWNRSYACYRTVDSILPKYLAYQLQTPSLERWRQTVVVGLRGSWWDALGPQTLFVPSLEDQQKAVDIVLNLEERVTKLREAHRRQEALLGELQESILVRAVYGLPMNGEVKV